MNTRRTPILDHAHLRRVFGTFPTGVVALAAVVGGQPVGMAVSSFTSVSLEPALVCVCIARGSATWPVLAEAERIGISILGAEHDRTARLLSSRGQDRFADSLWQEWPGGSLYLEGAVGWIDASISQVVPAGDHDIVVLQVHDLDAEASSHPLVFHASAFARLEHVTA